MPVCVCLCRPVCLPRFPTACPSVKVFLHLCHHESRHSKERCNEIYNDEMTTSGCLFFPPIYSSTPSSTEFLSLSLVFSIVCLLYLYMRVFLPSSFSRNRNIQLLFIDVADRSLSAPFTLPPGNFFRRERSIGCTS